MIVHVLTVGLHGITKENNCSNTEKLGFTLTLQPIHFYVGCTYYSHILVRFISLSRLNTAGKYTFSGDISPPLQQNNLVANSFSSATEDEVCGGGGRGWLPLIACHDEDPGSHHKIVLFHFNTVAETHTQIVRKTVYMKRLG